MWQFREIFYLWPYVRQHRDCVYCITDFNGSETCNHPRLGQIANAGKGEGRKLKNMVCFAFYYEGIDPKYHEYHQTKLTHVLMLITILISLFSGMLMQSFNNDDIKTYALETDNLRNDIQALKDQVVHEKNMMNQTVVELTHGIKSSTDMVVQERIWTRNAILELRNDIKSVDKIVDQETKWTHENLLSVRSKLDILSEPIPKKIGSSQLKVKVQGAVK